MSTLYRNYRPKNFRELVGQNHIKTTLQYEIELDRMAHSYLFCGPRGIGKTTIARVFAKAVNCINRKKGEHEPCEKCKSCLEIAKNKSLDIIEIDAASHTGVDNVRENIIAAARVVPNSLKYKIFIIDEVHMLSISAFNALLKILEEPPENVIFILCTTEAHKIPDTIISRCQRFDFKKINIPDIVKKLSYITKKEKIRLELAEVLLWEKKYNDAIAVLAGDALHALAFELLTSAGNSDVIFEVSKAIGISGMLGGQVADVEAEGHEVNLKQVEYIHRHKTGALIEVALRIGAMLANADDERLAIFSSYGSKIGLAFQIVDDLLDVIGSQEKLGKDIGSDTKNQKATYPGIVGLEKTKQIAAELAESAKNEIDRIGPNNAIFKYVADLVVGRES